MLRVIINIWLMCNSLIITTKYQHYWDNVDVSHLIVDNFKSYLILKIM